MKRIDEIDKQKIADYARHAVADLETHTHNRLRAATKVSRPFLSFMVKKRDVQDYNRHEHKVSKRNEGLKKAFDKLGEEEQLSELSKGKLVSYGKAAADDLEYHDSAAYVHKYKSFGKIFKGKHQKRSEIAAHKANNRYNGIQTAINKLSGNARVNSEEVEMSQTTNMIIQSVMQEPAQFADTFDDALKDVISVKLDHIKADLGKLILHDEEPEESQVSSEVKEEILKEKNNWFLYSDHEKHAQASTALDAALEHAKTLGSEARARDHMKKVQHQYRSAGATEPEPKAIIDVALAKHFKSQPDPVAKWRVGLLKGSK